MNFKLQKEIKLHDPLFDVRYHPVNHNLIAAATISGDVHLLEAGYTKSVVKKHHKGSSIRKVRFNKNGHMVTIAKTVKVYDLESQQTMHIMRRIDERKTPFYSLKTFGNYIVAAGDDDGRLMVWDTRSSTGNPLFTAEDCDQYISDIDGQYDGRRLIVCSSGEGTLTAYDMRAKKMIEPQSELFDAGFQCLQLDLSAKKVVVGGEDCALYIFNQNEWAHTSDKFSMANDSRHTGKCSIDCLDMLNPTTVLAGCSDGRLRAASLWPHRVMYETAYCRKSPLEAIHRHPDPDVEKFLVCGSCYVNIVECSQE